MLAVRPLLRAEVRMAAPAIDDHKLAVVLNLNAQRVTQRTVRVAKAVVGDEHVFATRTALEAEEACAVIVERGYGLVVPCGGDGTLTAVINQLVAIRRDRWGEAQPLAGMPKFGYLPLGTGNGMAGVVGPRRRPRRALEAFRDIARAGVSSSPSLSVPLLQIDGGDLCFFAGCGFDSLMLSDYEVVRRWVRRLPVARSLLQSVAGYFVAYFCRTLPQCLVGRHRVKARVTAPPGSPVYLMDPRRGDFAVAVEPGDDHVLWEGTAGIVRASVTMSPPWRWRALTRLPTPTGHARRSSPSPRQVAFSVAPYYGGGLKLFPFGGIVPGHLQMRVASLPPLSGLVHLPSIFAGTFRDRKGRVVDYVGRRFRVELARAYAFQHSGEAMGKVGGFELSIAEGDVRFVDLLPKHGGGTAHPTGPES